MSAITNFHQSTDRIACSGQPTEEQLRTIANDGYKVVVNLGLSGKPYSLPDEAASAQQEGLVYYHIPVQFDDPQEHELLAFFSAMNQHHGEKIWVHCAANYRASCFTGLYLYADKQLSHDEMTDMIESVWQPDAVWQQFIDDSVEWLDSD